MEYYRAHVYDIAELAFAEQISIEEATSRLNKFKVINDMHTAYYRRLCKTEGHALVNAGSYASPEGAKDMFECRRCGFSFEHIYF